MFSHRLAGFCRLRIVGGAQERFINLATQRNIEIWNLRDLGGGVLLADVSLRSLKAVRYVAKAAGCSLEVVEKQGLPITLRRLRHRKSFLSALIVGFLLLVLFSQSILKVEIETEKALTAQEKARILAISAEHGIRPYTFAWNLDWQAAAEDILRRSDGYTWVGFRKDGVFVQIRLVEREKPPPENDEIGDIVAKSDGVVREIFVLKGQKKVEVGDAVRGGDVLISGTVTPAEPGAGSVYTVHPEGLVRGSVWYEATASCGIDELKPRPTGVHRDYIGLYWQEREYVLWGAKENGFVDYEEKKTGYRWGVLRLELVSREELAVKEGGYSEKEAREIAVERAGAMLVTKIAAGARIVKEEAFPVAGEGKIVTVRLVVETYEDLGKFVPAAGEKVEN